MPLTNQGFERLSFDDVLNLQIERAKLLFGDDIDTSEQSTFGKILRLYCLDAAENQELAEGVYLSAFPHSASGVSLDRLCPFVGITRNAADYAQHEITIKGKAGTTVQMGFLVSAGDVVFHTLNVYTVGDDGTVTVIVECNEAGTIGNVTVGDITDIVNPIADITSITHTAIAKYAQDEETDYELRNRFTQALSGGSGTLDSIRGAILRVQGVESAMIIENSTGATVNDIAPHSFICYVLAPTSTRQEIAKAIFSKKPIGIATSGTETVTVKDIGGGDHEIKFSWTEEVNIYVRCTVKVTSFADQDKEIKNNIIKKLATYTNGQNVTATSLYSAIYVDGVTDVTSLEISSDGETYSTATISIANNQVARTSIDNIAITAEVSII
jgi:uncharacterized phage protein gp47/JayE